MHKKKVRFERIPVEAVRRLCQNGSNPRCISEKQYAGLALRSNKTKSSNNDVNAAERPVRP